MSTGGFEREKIRVPKQETFSEPKAGPLRRLGTFGRIRSLSDLRDYLGNPDTSHTVIFPVHLNDLNDRFIELVASGILVKNKIAYRSGKLAASPVVDSLAGIELAEHTRASRDVPGSLTFQVTRAGFMVVKPWEEKRVHMPLPLVNAADIPRDLDRRSAYFRDCFYDNGIVSGLLTMAYSGATLRNFHETFDRKKPLIGGMLKALVDRWGGDQKVPFSSTEFSTWTSADTRFVEELFNLLSYKDEDVRLAASNPGLYQEALRKLMEHGFGTAEAMQDPLLMPKDHIARQSPVVVLARATDAQLGAHNSPQSSGVDYFVSQIQYAYYQRTFSRNAREAYGTVPLKFIH